MALPHPSSRLSKFAGVLKYFDKYDYPLTKEEIYRYSTLRVPSPNLGEGLRKEYNEKNGYFFLPGRQKIVALRQQREQISQTKWLIAKNVAEKLKKFSFIQAIYVTGSLAMNNATIDDDIDLMLVTTANTLWLTRFFVNLYLASVRRYPRQKDVANVVCINLWLDENNLTITPHDLYRAHEIIQAKVLWDRNNIAQKFLAANEWVGDFLPNAYHLTPPSGTPLQNFGEGLGVRLIGFVNLLFFIFQFIYMKPKMTTERVGPGYAFFHPHRA